MGVKRNLDEAGIASGDKISEGEAALYDRQIRLWGMECQKRLREARILVVGLNGVGAEVVKNLTLGGVKSISILDDKEVTPADTIAQFFLCSYKPGQKRAEASVSAIQELNPNVNIEVLTGDIFSKPADFFKGFTAMMATDCGADDLIKLNNLCREHDLQFYCTGTWGFYGYCFLDLQEHTFRQILNKTIKDDQAHAARKRREQDDDQILEEVYIEFIIGEAEDTKVYCPLVFTLQTKVGDGLKRRVNKVFVLFHVVNQFWEMFSRLPCPESREDDVKELKKIRKLVCEKLGFEETKISDEMLNCMFGELSPVCAVVGGILANEIIKGISSTGMPIYNYFLFDGIESQGVNETIIVDA